MMTAYAMALAEPPSYDSSPKAIARFWDEYHSSNTSPAQRADFVRRHPGIAIPDPIGPRTTYADSSPLTFLADDHRYQNQTPNVAAETAAREAIRKQKIDAANAELQRRKAIAQAKIDANLEYARELHWRYNKRVKDGPPPDHSRAETANEIKIDYICVRGFEPMTHTYEYADHTHKCHVRGSCSQAAWDRATRELAGASNAIGN